MLTLCIAALRRIIPRKVPYSLTLGQVVLYSVPHRVRRGEHARALRPEERDGGLAGHRQLELALGADGVRSMRPPAPRASSNTKSALFPYSWTSRSLFSTPSCAAWRARARWGTE